MGMQRLNPLTFPLHGSHLIEASAGTGKTYTIAALYLRLLLERQLSVTQILVVTFTEAATQELRGRIRQRLLDARLYLQGLHESDDLAALLSPYAGDPERIRQLNDAIIRMDEAAIYTIHGFCQRTLSDSAFESGALFDSEFTSEESPLWLQAARDFWRLTLGTADSDEAAWIRSQWSTPEALLKAIEPLTRHPQATREPVARDDRGADERYRQAFEELALQWREQGESVRELLDSAPNLSRNAKLYRGDRLTALYEALQAYLDAGSDSMPPVDLRLLSSSVISDPASLIKKKVPPEHPLFDTVERLLLANAERENLRLAHFLGSAADAIGERLEQFKAGSRTLFFDDLLRRLEQALSAAGGAALAQRVRSQHPVAMIDEFQDTDPLQYRLFQHIYQGQEPCGLFMIGDPKQAIYSFRGADIFTYMRARHDTGDAPFTLETNWRSHSRLVEAVNALFGQAAAPFIYDEEIPFQAVAAAGRADHTPLRIDGVEPAPLGCWFVPREAHNDKNRAIPATWARPRIAQGCASEIARLLSLGQAGRATIGERTLAARDIAILVRNRTEAASIRQALGEAGVSSVTLSRDSVFDSEEAGDLTHLLRAVADPGDPGLLRTALATRLLGWEAAAIHQLNHDEEAWEARVEAFRGYHRLWLSHGFMPMLHTLLRGEGVIARLLAQGEGERRMTNLLQLAELAQLAERRHPGAERLLRWLSDRRSQENGDNEEQQLRLESDENLVQIVTIHKSKGLEYPLVFLPFLWSARQSKNEGVLGYHDEHERDLRLDIGSPSRGGTRERALLLAERERLAEDLRLLYVALTRAQYRCTLSWGCFNGAEYSALAWLLHSGGMAELDDEAIRATLAPLFALEPLPEPGTCFLATDEGGEGVMARSFDGDARQRWRMTSFTALSLAHDHHRDYRTELPDHDLGVDEAVSLVDTTPDYPPFRFPRGAHAGLFLHQLFENIDFPEAGGEPLQALVAQALEQYGLDPQWNADVCTWLEAVLDTPLNEDGLCLRRIGAGQRLVEMEFHFPVAELEATGLNRLLTSERGAGRAAVALEFGLIDGLLKGFVDLIFEFEGRFYIVDYKSNHLGDRLEAYRPERLREAIDDHHYDLQYLIYTLALHRYLQGRLADYDYEQHFGGIYYLFLRGMRPENGATTGVHADRPPLETLEALEQLIGGGR